MVITTESRISENAVSVSLFACRQLDLPVLCFSLSVCITSLGDNLFFHFSLPPLGGARCLPESLRRARKKRALAK